MKRKVWELTVLDNPNRVVMGENDEFYTTDTEAFLIFRSTDADFNPTTATLTLANTSDKSVINEIVPVIDKVIEWEMPKEVIAHFGNWQAQLVYVQEKDGKDERYTSQVVRFDVQNHLMAGRQPTLVAIEDWNTFMATARDLLAQIEEEAGGIDHDSEQARAEAEDIRETNESQRISNESLRVSSETDRVSAEQNRVIAENDRSDLYDLVRQKLENGEFTGEKGDTGDGLEYVWNGTQLGVRKEGETEYVYVDLKGPKGDPGVPGEQGLEGPEGPKGDPGEMGNLDSSRIVDALGYTPISANDVPEPTWENLQDKPTTFAPATHTHSINDVEGLRDELDSVPELTKENVGLGNVDNVKQASKVEHDQLVTYYEELEDSIVVLEEKWDTVNFLEVVNHGSTSNYARPVGALSVLWLGSVEPQNALDNDIWVGG